MDALRRLSVDQQVGLLFVGLLGALLCATATLVLWSLRRESRSVDDGDALLLDTLQRELRAVWIGAAVFWLAWVSGALGATLLFGAVSFLALREFITLVHTRRGDHRGLILAFFVVLPLQYLIVGTRRFDLFTVFIPVYAFFALPVVAALAGDPQRFLERNAKIQWGVMVCVYGLSHAPALLLAPAGQSGRGAFLVFFLVVVTSAAQLVQEAASRSLRRRPAVRRIDRSFSWRTWALGALAAGAAGALLTWSTPFEPSQAVLLGLVAGGAGTLGGLVMKALKKDAGVRHWGNRPSVTGAVGLLDRVAPLCFAAPVFFHALRWYVDVA
ncbi:MAG: phosphatidate cytidylyltransferase [Rubrivivax sp.]